MAIIISLYTLALAMGIFQEQCGSDNGEANLGSNRGLNLEDEF